jgi:hypothetical protein
MPRFVRFAKGSALTASSLSASKHTPAAVTADAARTITLMFQSGNKVIEMIATRHRLVFFTDP